MTGLRWGSSRSTSLDVTTLRSPGVAVLAARPLARPTLGTAESLLTAWPLRWAATLDDLLLTQAVVALRGRGQS